jgi:23S rRNA (guanine745-N1)-methyltransferase
VTLLCPVRGCAEPLAWGERALGCPRGHSFDLARSGYCNLLQPQDKRAREPGDSAAAVAARRRLLDRGLGNALRDALVDRARALGLREGSPALDAGCGEGFFLAALCGALRLDGWGVDVSSRALAAAAKRYPSLRWVGANADRRLPFADGSFDLALSITASKNGAELGRVLAPGGHLLVAIPGPGDLAELREAVLGEARRVDRSDRALELLGDRFELRGRDEIRWSARIDREGIADLLTVTYRGARRSERARIESLQEMEVTSEYVLLALERR